MLYEFYNKSDEYVALYKQTDDENRSDIWMLMKQISVDTYNYLFWNKFARSPLPTSQVYDLIINKLKRYDVVL